MLTNDPVKAREEQHRAFLKVMSGERGPEYLETVYLFGTPDEVIASLQARVDAGVEQFILHTMTPDPSQLDAWVREIIPNVVFPETAGPVRKPEPRRGRHRVVTGRVALLGKPLRRRHSVVMHNAAFAAAGIDGEYVLAEVDESAVPAAVEAARQPGSLGLGVTAPYKELVASLVDEVEGDARAIGAVNNVVRNLDARLIGFNTDAPGFRVAVELAMGRSISDADVVVVGAGGAARAVVFAALSAGARRVTVANRTVASAEAIAERFRGVGSAVLTVVSLDSDGLVGALGAADLAVNATTVGMVDPGTAFPVELLPTGATVFDLVYVPAETPLIAAARQRGLRAANGSEMLIAQAAIAFERWTGVGGMADVMRAAVAPLLADPTVRA